MNGNARNLELASVWMRFFARMLDGILNFLLALLLWPLTVAALRNDFILLIIISSAASLFAYIWCAVRFGGTPGKLLLGVRIVDEAGLYLSWGKAFRRFVPEIAIAINGVLQFAAAMYNAPSYSHWDDFMKAGMALNAYGQPFTLLSTLLGFAFIAEACVMFMNAERRAGHDFLGESYVVRVKSVPGVAQPPKLPARQFRETDFHQSPMTQIVKSPPVWFGFTEHPYAYHFPVYCAPFALFLIVSDYALRKEEMEGFGRHAITQGCRTISVFGPHADLWQEAMTLAALRASADEDDLGKLAVTSLNGTTLDGALLAFHKATREREDIASYAVLVVGEKGQNAMPLHKRVSETFRALR